MSSTPSTTSGPPSTSKPSPPIVSNPPFTIERLAAWVLPLAAVCLLLGALSMAVVSGEIRMWTAGVAVYAVCLAMWWTVAALRRTSMAPPTVPPPGTSPSSAPSRPQELTFQTEFQEFADFANLLFPWLALLVLTGSSIGAAVMKQQQWLITGIVTLCGWWLVWIGHLVLSSLRREKYPSSGSQQTALPLLDRYQSIGLLLLSFLVFPAAIRFGLNPGLVKWLAIGIFAQILYFAWSVRRLGQVQTAVGVSLAVLPGILLLALASGVAVAVFLHRLTWIFAAAIGYSGCLAIWLFQIIRSLRKAAPPKDRPDGPPQSSVPLVALELLTGAMLVSLGLALYLREISALKAALVSILGGLSLWFAWMFVSSVEREGPPQIDTNWGGLGGGLGGWRCSSSLVYGLCALTFGICTGITFLQLPAAPSSVGTNTSIKTSEAHQFNTEKKSDTAFVQPTEPTPAIGKDEQAVEKEKK